MVAEGVDVDDAGGLRDDLVQVANAPTPEDLLQQTVAFATRLGFDTVGAVVIIDRHDAPYTYHAIHNLPAQYNSQFEDSNRAQRCPVAQHCKQSSRPIAWNQRTYTAAGMGELWESQAMHGLRAGVAVAWHLPQGRHFLIGVDCDQPLPRDRAEVSRLAAELQLFGAHAQDAALRLLVPSQPPDPEPRLSARELEMLRWTMDGKTAWETGRIVGLSDQTVARHLQNATRKLNAVNKRQAVVKALRLGLLK